VPALRIVFLLIGAALATFYPFQAVILADRGFDPTAIGLVTAAASVAFTVSVPVWGHLADVRLGRTGALRIGAWASGLALVAFGAPWPLVVLAFMVLAFAGTESTLAPLSDALAVNVLRDPERQYPSIRLLTSLSFAIVAIACGYLFDRTGYWPATLLYAGVAFAVGAAASFVPDRPRADLGRLRGGRGGDPAHRAGRGGSMRVAFAVQPRLPFILVAILLVHVGVIAGFTFLGLRIIELGGNPSDVALSAGLSALAEIPGMILAGRLVGRLGLRGLFAGGAVVYAVCIAAWVVVDSPLAIVGTRVVTGFAFSAIWIAAVLTIQRLLPDRLQGTGQGLYQTTAFGIAAVVANLAGGVIIAAAGSTGPYFAIAAAFTGSAAFVGWAALPGRREPRPAWPGDVVAPDPTPRNVTTP
jgi:PPP family 3-phenylpropionic acid transporter